jgi:hypothetical protein
MNYEKPDVNLIASAVETIKGSSKDDDVAESTLATIDAYEADE